MHPHHDAVQSARRMTAKAFSNNAELTKEYWLNSAKGFVEKQLARASNAKKAKNVILFLGDGMSHSSLGETLI
jgi:alkaline phosphatase